MVKKKSPVIPLTIAAIMVSIVFAVNTQLHPKSADELKKEDQDAAAKAAQNNPPTQTRAPDKKSEMELAMKQSLANAKPGAPPSMAKANPAANNGQGNIMVNKQQPLYHPKPSATSPSSEWWVK